VVLEDEGEAVVIVEEAEARLEVAVLVGGEAVEVRNPFCYGCECIIELFCRW
jgi:hypothetical protein